MNQRENRQKLYFMKVCKSQWLFNQLLQRTLGRRAVRTLDSLSPGESEPAQSSGCPSSCLYPLPGDVGSF